MTEPTDEERDAGEVAAEEAFLASHGYPRGVDRAWIEGRIAQRCRRQMRLKELKAPPVILEGEARLIAQGEAWLAAYDREHPLTPPAP